MSQALRKLAGNLNRAKTVCLFTNQIREKIGVMFGSPETQPGGRALKFYSSQRLDIRRIETLKEGTEAVGNRVRVKVVKNKVAAPFRQAEFDIEYGVGISHEGCLLDLALEHDLVQKSGSFFSYGEMRLGQGRNNTKQFLAENPEIAARDRGEDVRRARDRARRPAPPRADRAGSRGRGRARPTRGRPRGRAGAQGRLERRGSCRAGAFERGARGARRRKERTSGRAARLARERGFERRGARRGDRAPDRGRASSTTSASPPPTRTTSASCAAGAPERIREALAARGIAPALVEAALEADSHGAQVERASDLLARRGQPLVPDADGPGRSAILTRRGYEYELAYEAIRLAARQGGYGLARRRSRALRSM